MTVLEYNKFPCIGKSSKTGSVVKFSEKLTYRIWKGICLKVGKNASGYYVAGTECTWNPEYFYVIPKELKYRND